MARWVYWLAMPLAVMPLQPSGLMAQQPPVTLPLAVQPPTAPPPLSAPPVSTSGEAVVPVPVPPPLSQAELQSLVAPIALYPDDLLIQVLVASTYPLEVVMAARWVGQPGHNELHGDPLLKALTGQDWDASVKSLAPFPMILTMMSDQLEWTQKLGEAFLAQQADVFTAVQALRARAQTAGTLKSTPQQKVVQEGSTLIIQPAQPDTVYVPAYNPSVAFGEWPYPSYPPVYYPPPAGAYVGTALLTGLAFGAGVALTSSLWGWGSPNWGGGYVNVNVNRFNSINVNRFNNFQSNRPAFNGDRWQHNVDHRRGVSYGNANLRRQYRPSGGGNIAQRDAFRGRQPINVTNNVTNNVGNKVGNNVGNIGNKVGNNVGSGNVGSGNVGSNLGQRAGAGGNAANYQRPNGGAGNGNLQGKLQNAQRPNGGAGGANVQGKLQNVQRPNGGAGAGNLQGKIQNVQRPNIGGGGGERPAFAQNFQRPGGGGGAPAFQGLGNGGGIRAEAAQGRASRAGLGGGGGGGGFARGGGGGFAHSGGGGGGGGIARGGGGGGGGFRGGRH